MKFLSANGYGVEETQNYLISKFLGKVAVTTGVRSHIIRTYLKEIEDAGLITVKDNMIYWNGQQD